MGIFSCSKQSWPSPDVSFLAVNDSNRCFAGVEFKDPAVSCGSIPVVRAGGKSALAIRRMRCAVEGARMIPSDPPSGGSSVRGCPAALSERSEFSGRPDWRPGAREAAGRDSGARFFGYFLAARKKVPRPPGRVPAKLNQSRKVGAGDTALRPSCARASPR